MNKPDFTRWHVKADKNWLVGLNDWCHQTNAQDNKLAATKSPYFIPQCFDNKPTQTHRQKGTYSSSCDPSKYFPTLTHHKLVSQYDVCDQQ